MLYSSSMTQVGARYLVMQLVWCALGLVLCVTAASMDYQLLRKLAWPLFAFAVLLLLLVLVPHIGRKINGARRWFNFHGFRFQPSELGKLALIVVLAWYGEHFQRQMPSWKRGIFIPAAYIGLLLGLIFVEPDRGTTILMAAVSSAMLLIAGVRWKCFLPPIILGACAFAVSIWHDPLRMKRVFSWLYSEEYKDTVGYQARQAMIALGSGGWTGSGSATAGKKPGSFPNIIPTSSCPSSARNSA